MNKQQLFSLGVVGLLCLVIVLTYNSWELWRGALVLWAMLLTFEIFILVGYLTNWIIEEIDNGK